VSLSLQTSSSERPPRSTTGALRCSCCRSATSGTIGQIWTTISSESSRRLSLPRPRPTPFTSRRAPEKLKEDGEEVVLDRLRDILNEVREEVKPMARKSKSTERMSLRRAPLTSGTSADT
jgi:hypothetical protein